MSIDYYDLAKKLEVVNVWEPGNQTGYVTPRVLYDPSLHEAPRRAKVARWILHGTAGTNTLAFWGNGGSAVPGNWTVANMLVPHERTQYKNGSVHDTTNVVFKMVPDGYACNHTGACSANVSNNNAFGVEYESKQDGTDDISDTQLIKGALLYANGAALEAVPDWFCLMHGIVRVPWPERRDPFAGKFNIARHWEHVLGIRADIRVWQFWGLAQP